MEVLLEKHLHQIPADEVITLFDSDAVKGLDLFEIQARQRRFGPNAIPVQRGHGPLIRFLLHFHQPLVYILLAAGTITAVLNEWIDAGVIFAVVLVNATIGFLQESEAAKALDALSKMTVTDARVLRSGEVHKIPSVELVPGDIVVLQSGDKVPADLRLFRCRDLQMDESTLTGESVPVQKNAEPLPAETPLAERSNMAFSSTLVTYGQGRGVVCATGAKTEVGRISELVSAADVMETPLTRKIARFSRLLLVVILALAAITFVVGVLRGETPFGLGVFSNPWIAVGVTAMVALQLAFTYLPFMNHMFHSAPIGWYAWWLILLTGSAVYVIVGTEKLLRRQWAKRRGAIRTGTA